MTGDPACPTCPSCGAELASLECEYVKRTYGRLSVSSRSEGRGWQPTRCPEMLSTTYRCPRCRAVLFDDYDDAEAFLWPGGRGRR